jgi:hypothetical protein
MCPYDKLKILKIKNKKSLKKKQKTFFEKRKKRGGQSRCGSATPKEQNEGGSLGLVSATPTKINKIKLFRV